MMIQFNCNVAKYREKEGLFTTRCITGIGRKALHYLAACLMFCRRSSWTIPIGRYTDFSKSAMNCIGKRSFIMLLEAERNLLDGLQFK